MYLGVPQDWDEIAEIVTDAYRAIAPKTLVNLLDTPLDSQLDKTRG